MYRHVAGNFTQTVCNEPVAGHLRYCRALGRDLVFAFRIFRAVFCFYVSVWDFISGTKWTKGKILWICWITGCPRITNNFIQVKEP